MCISKSHIFKSFIIVFIISCLSGCLTPQVRYTRPSRSGRQARRTVTPVEEKVKKRSSAHAGPVLESRLKGIVASYIGVPYKYGGTTRNGMDCSGFVWRVYTELGHSDFLRTSSAKMRNLGTTVSRKNAKAGDLVFFRKWRRINHVGIYMGNNKFAHASSKKGIIYTSLDDECFGKRLVCIRRIF